MSSRLLLSTITVYILCCLSLLLQYTPGHDTLYYFNWSQHLALGYYDAPPVIAYYFRLFTVFLGTSARAIVFIGLLSNTVIACLVYLLAKTLFNKQVAVYSLIGWLATPIAFGVYGLQVTCDTPACIFAILTLYLFYLFHKCGKPIYVYAAAITASLMMLSKLTGATIFMSLVVLMLTKNYRYLLRNKHTYFACLLFLAWVLPMMIWGADHGKEGIQVQLRHGLAHWTVYHILNIANYAVANIAMYTLYLLLFIYFYVKYFRKIQSSAQLQLVCIPAATVFLFYLLTSLSGASIHWNWNDLFYTTVPIGMACAAMQTQGMKRFFSIATIINLVIILLLNVFIISNITGSVRLNKILANNAGKRLALELASTVKDQRYVFSNDYKLNALLNYYVPRKHTVYSFPKRGNQYQYWSVQANQSLEKRLINNLIFLTTDATAPIIKGYRCHPVYKSKADLGVNLAIGQSTSRVNAFACYKDAAKDR